MAKTPHSCCGFCDLFTFHWLDHTANCQVINSKTQNAKLKTQNRTPWRAQSKSTMLDEVGLRPTEAFVAPCRRRGPIPQPLPVDQKVFLPQHTPLPSHRHLPAGQR